MFKRNFFIFLKYTTENSKQIGYYKALIEYNWLSESKSEAVSLAFDKAITEIKEDNKSKFVITDVKIF